MKIRPAQDYEEIEKLLLKTMFPELEHFGRQTSSRVREAAIAIVDHYEEKN